ncbi:MAG: hypothetical protein RBT11_14685 [Desulfobacterales bacterium]|jgi:hypothetical protein|nr:hypothetical protein [Desulfobacterales bacterium]
MPNNYNQTKLLGKAAVEFLKRNPKQFKTYLDETGFGDFFKQLRVKYPNISEKELEDILAESLVSPAVVSDRAAASDAYYRAFKRLCAEMGWSRQEEDDWIFFGKPDPFEDRLNQYYAEELCMDSEKIIKNLMGDHPTKTLLVAIDTDRPMDAILSEVKALVATEKHGRFLNERRTFSRAKWLPKAEELLKVWDLYGQAGKTPGTVTFNIISKIVKRPLSTVKSQWRSAYEKIYNVPYEPAQKFSTEEKKESATELCAKCPYGAKCYKSGDWYPCADYLRIAGKERGLKTVELSESLFADD